MPTRVLRREAGFTLAELLTVAALVATVSAIAVPQLLSAAQRYRTTSGAREVAAQIRAARLAAVTTNRQMIVRFNCPVARAYRFVEVTGNAAIDNLAAADRCAQPPPDADPATLPNADGPMSFLPETVSFTATQDLRIGPTGIVTPLAGGLPAVIGVTNGAMVGQVTVSATGRVQVQ
jgi:type II secretion system protein H